MKVVRVMVLSVALVFGIGCGRDTSPPPPLGGPGSLHGIVLSYDGAPALAVGQTAQLSVIAHIGTGVVNQTTASQFTVSDSAVLSVGPDGVATALTAGTAVVTAALDGAQSNEVTLTVAAPTAPAPR